MHWLAALWQAMWPNVFAPSAPSLAGLAWVHWRQRREHQKTREHISGTNSEGER